MKVFSKHISLVILLCLGFFLLPSITFACAKKTTKVEQKSCSKDQSIKSSKHDCDHDKSCSTDKQHKKCGGKCKHNSCKCSTTVTSLSLPAYITFSSKKIFAETKKQKFGFKQAYYSSDISSIWQPPKIS